MTLPNFPSSPKDSSTTPSSSILSGSTSPQRGIIEIKNQRDPILTQLRQMKTVGGRKKVGCFIAEGPDLCRRALRYGAGLEALICTPQFAQSEEGLSLRTAIDSICSTYVCTQGLLNKCLEAKPTPSCVGIVQFKTQNAQDMIHQAWQNSTDSSTAPLFIAVDRGDYADNLGMLLRSAEASGVSGVLLSKETTDPFHRRVTRGARGANFKLPLALDVPLSSLLKEAQTLGYQVVTSSANVEKTCYDVDYTQPTILVVGNEHNGIQAHLIEQSDHCVCIPMHGLINSLNISVAASILLFEAQRQKRSGS